MFGVNPVGLTAIVISRNQQQLKHGTSARRQSVGMGLQGMSEMARPLSEWHEDIGPVVWWKFPVTEAPWIGTPEDMGSPHSLRVELDGHPVTAYVGYLGGWPGYHTHWTPLPEVPEMPTESEPTDDAEPTEAQEWHDFDAEC